MNGGMVLIVPSAARVTASLGLTSKLYVDRRPQIPKADVWKACSECLLGAQHVECCNYKILPVSVGPWVIGSAFEARAIKVSSSSNAGRDFVILGKRSLVGCGS